MNNMTVQIKEASIEQKPILQQLMQLYQYDFSEIDSCDVNEDGIFEYKYLDLYWTEPNRLPFLVYVEEKIVGFVLINNHGYVSDDKRTHVVSEFFIMRKYRRQGIGTYVAQKIFRMFSGKWEVWQTENNKIAQSFWRKVINDYTKGDYKEIYLDNESWKGSVQMFTTA